MSFSSRYVLTPFSDVKGRFRKIRVRHAGIDSYVVLSNGDLVSFSDWRDCYDRLLFGKCHDVLEPLVVLDEVCDASS